MRRIYAVEYYAAVKKNGITPSAATWVTLGKIILREERQRTANTLCCHSHVESKKEVKQMNAYANTESDPQILPVGRGKGKGKIAGGEYKGQVTMYKIDKLERDIVLQ